MTISAYQIDNVIKSYSKQHRGRLRFDEPAANPARSADSDLVTLKGDTGEADIYQKISYSLMDLLKK